MEYELYHWGIKGMKWGVRRYQRKDGSWTPIGRKRYKQKEAERERAKQAREEETLEYRKQKILKSRSAAELYKNADLFSTAELQSAYNRLQLERNIANLAPREVSKGEEFVNKSINFGRKVNDVADVSTKLYNNVAKVYNTFSETAAEKPLPLIKDGGDKKKDK